MEDLEFSVSKIDDIHLSRDSFRDRIEVVDEPNPGIFPCERDLTF